MYIWQREAWPNFIWDNDVIDNNAYVYGLEASRLIGEVRHLSEKQKTDTLIDLMVSEAIKTSQIEGENFDREDVRSSLRNQLGLNVTPDRVGNPRANGVAALMISVQDHFSEPLTQERLWTWQEQIFVGNYERNRLDVGQWRRNPEPMQVVSGAIGKEKVHYEAPPSGQVPFEMKRFINWFNNSRNLKGAIRSGIAHLYFACIHPFSDGNGRIGRAISEVALFQEFGCPVLLSLSTALQNRRQDYYEALNRASLGGLDITQWLIWFTEVVLEAQKQAREHIAFVLSKARFWEIYTHQLNQRQSQVLNRMLREGVKGFQGGMSARKYMKITQCSKATATRDLVELFKIGALKRLEGGGRNTRYDIQLPTQVSGVRCRI